MTISFAEDELETLRSNGIVIFADRVIFDAQPPMSHADIDAIEKLCSGKLPSALRALWSQTAGGSINYDLNVNIRGRKEPVGFTELFYNGSKHYNDLQGWINHEVELCEDIAAEEGREWSGKLDCLPIGGFEYCDRIYVVTTPGPENGRVVAWKQGYPPAWTDCLHEDSANVFADDLYQAFSKLALEDDPRHPVSQFPMGEELIDYLQTRVNKNLPKNLAEKVLDFFCQALPDWRTPLLAGTISEQPEMARIALIQSILLDDCELIRLIAAAKVVLDKPLQGKALPTQFAVQAGKFRAAQALIDVGAAVDKKIMSSLDKAVPASLAESLLKNGAKADVEIVIKCAACGAPESARLVAAAVAKNTLNKSFEGARTDMLQELENDLEKVRQGKLGHYLGEQGLMERIANLRNFKLTEL